MHSIQFVLMHPIHFLVHFWYTSWCTFVRYTSWCTPDTLPDALKYNLSDTFLMHSIQFVLMHPIHFWVLVLVWPSESRGRFLKDCLTDNCMYSWGKYPRENYTCSCGLSYLRWRHVKSCLELSSRSLAWAEAPGAGSGHAHPRIYYWKHTFTTY